MPHAEPGQSCGELNGCLKGRDFAPNFSFPPSPLDRQVNGGGASKGRLFSLVALPEGVAGA